jgi:hypothetical protein
MKTYGGSRSIDPCILVLDTIWRWMVNFTPRPLYLQGKSPSYLLDRRLCGPQSRSGRSAEEKNSQPLQKGLKLLNRMRLLFCFMADDGCKK